MTGYEIQEAKRVISAVATAGSELRIRDGKLKVRNFADLPDDLQRSIRECKSAITSILSGELDDARERAETERQREAVATFRVWMDAGILADVTEPIAYKRGHIITDLYHCVSGYLREATSGREPFASLAGHHLAAMLPAVRAVVDAIETQERRAA